MQALLNAWGAVGEGAHTLAPRAPQAPALGFREGYLELLMSKPSL